MKPSTCARDTRTRGSSFLRGRLAVSSSPRCSCRSRLELGLHLALHTETFPAPGEIDVLLTSSGRDLSVCDDRRGREAQGGQ